MLRKHIILLFAVCCFSFSVKSQQAGYEILNSLAAKLVNTVDNSSSLFLHIDKTVQSAGGTIWCKAYLFQQSNRIPITTPEIVYIDLINANDSIISHVILESGDLRLEAAIPIPHNITTGYYTIRAYTKEMAVNNPNGIFYCPVYISNVLSTTSSSGNENCLKEISIRKPFADVQLIPEGNWLINGIDNKVAVVSFDKN